MADVAHEDEAIESEERNFIHSVIEFGDTIVREVMVPRIDMVDIADSATVREAFDLAVAVRSLAPAGPRRGRRRRRRHREPAPPRGPRGERPRRARCCASTWARPTSCPRPNASRRC